MNRKAIVGGCVFSAVDDHVIEDGVVLVEDNRITAVGNRHQVPVPGEAEIISATGGFVVPGLIDAHNHLYMDPGPFQGQSLDPDIVLFQRGIRNARAQLRDGVTTIRECGTPHFIDLRLKDSIEQGLIPGPHLVCAGEWLTASDGHGAFPGAAAIADGPDEVRKAARRVLREGVDFVKIMVTGGTATRWASPTQAYFDPGELRAIVDEVHRHGKQVAAHAHGGPGVQHAVEAGIDTLEHGSMVTDEAVIDLIAERRVGWMFNQGARMADPDPALPEFERQKILASRQTSIEAFQRALRAGVRIMAGVDGHHDHHASVWSLEALIKCGATPLQALVAATRTPAEVIGLDRGTLQPGNFADMLIVNGNPLENVSALRDLRMVMKEGVVFCER